jgi:isopenicillin N synthase-like dioxygenase
VNPPGTEADDLPPILVNVGDLLQYWTDGRLRSTVHRVVFDPDDPGTPRYSIAYFCHPADHTPIGPVPLIPPAGPPRVPHIAVAGAATASTDSTVMTAREHLMMKLAATYGSIYKETA